jgi:hypothetical protein
MRRPRLATRDVAFLHAGGEQDHFHLAQCVVMSQLCEPS